MRAISSYRGNRPTNKQTHKHTGPITIHCAAKLSAQCNNEDVYSPHRQKTQKDTNTKYKNTIQKKNTNTFSS